MNPASPPVRFGGHVHAQVIPSGVLIAIGGVLLFSIALAYGARRSHLAHPEPALGPALESLQVRFEDRPNGSIAMLDDATGAELAQVPPQSNGFIRGVLRGMFRSRKLESVGHQPGFRLAREADGHLSLTDPQTGRLINLDSFGPTNSDAFAKLLEAGRAHR